MLFFLCYHGLSLNIFYPVQRAAFLDICKLKKVKATLFIQLSFDLSYVFSAEEELFAASKFTRYLHEILKILAQILRNKQNVTPFHADSHPSNSYHLFPVSFFEEDLMRVYHREMQLSFPLILADKYSHKEM